MARKRSKSPSPEQELFRSVLGEARQNAFLDLVQRGAEALPDLYLALQSEHAEVRADAAEALGLLGDVRALEPLKATLRDPDLAVQGRAAESIAKLGGAELGHEFVKFLGDTERRTVIGAAAVLGRMRFSPAIEPLRAMFRTDDELLGKTVAWALGELRASSAVPDLLVALEAGFALVEVVQALGKIGDPRALGPLERACEHPDPVVRAQAVKALGELGDPHAAAALRRRLEDAHPVVKLGAAVALYQLGDNSGVPIVMKAAARDLQIGLASE